MIFIDYTFFYLSTMLWGNTLYLIPKYFHQWATIFYPSSKLLAITDLHSTFCLPNLLSIVLLNLGICSMYQYTILLIYYTCWWTFGLFHFGNAAMNRLVKLWEPVFRHTWWCMSETGRQEGQKFEVMFGYIESSRPAWATPNIV